MSNHAMLSASGASRWLACPPSARYELNFPEQESEYANEGTLAHELANLLIQKKVYNLFLEPQISACMQHHLYNEEMMEYCERFAEHVFRKYKEAPEGKILLLEQRLNLSDYIPEGFGTVDVGIASDMWLEIDDLKYGKGVPVHAEENKQLMIYALGMLREVDLLYNIQNVRLTIYQPRIDNISSYEISVENLKRWAHEELMPGAKIAFEGGGEFKAGSHCRFCKAKSMCPTLAKYSLQIAKYEFLPVPQLSDEQVVKILDKADTLRKFLTSVEEHALKAALNGKVWPGKKLVKGRSVRKYTDEQEIIDGLLSANIPEETFYEKKLTGITNLSKRLSKLDFEKYVEPYLIKPDGTPTLVDDSDQRPEINSTRSAASDFST